MSWQEAVRVWAADNWEWCAAVVGTVAAFRRKRLVGIVREEFNPEQLHNVLADVQTDVKALNATVVDLRERVSYIKGRIDGEVQRGEKPPE
jgi:hypothetical protein